MKKLITTWSVDDYTIDPETGKKDKLLSTDIHSVFQIGKDRYVAEIETIDFDEHLNPVENGKELNVEFNGKLFIEDIHDLSGGISKAEYKELVRAAIGGNVNEGTLSQAIYKAAYKIQRLGKYPKLFYSAEWVEVGVQLYHDLKVTI